jgi:hypothetical protein
MLELSQDPRLPLRVAGQMPDLSPASVDSQEQLGGSSRTKASGAPRNEHRGTRRVHVVKLPDCMMPKAPPGRL